MVDPINQDRERGLPGADAVAEGDLRRLRPILMTVLATVFALTPTALGITRHGGFISRPLAVVVIGGLVSSTVLTLVLIPVLYPMAESRRGAGPHLQRSVIDHDAGSNSSPDGRLSLLN
nr:efflux RND transporter permease subunit [Kineosporia mesophila]